MRRAVVLSGQGVQVEGRKNDLDDLALVSTKRAEVTLPPFSFGILLKIMRMPKQISAVFLCPELNLRAQYLL